MSYSSEVLADSPLAYWRLGDASVMADSSGNARHGGFVGTSAAATGLVSGDTDGAHSFSGGSRGVVAAAPWMDASSFTVLATITPTAVTGIQSIVGRYDSYSGSTFAPSSFVLRLNANKLECHIFVGNTPGAATTVATLTAGTTYDVAATYDGTTVKVYLNGGSMVSASRAGMNNSDYPLTIGNTYTTSNTEAFGGVIDDVAYIGSVLSATDISTLATKRSSGSGYASAVLAFSPLAYYRLGDPSGSTPTLTDSSGNGHNGTYNGLVAPGATGLLASDSDKAIGTVNGIVAQVPYAAWMDVNTLTVEAWVRPTATGVAAGNHEIVVRDIQGSGGGGSQWRLMIVGGKAQALLWHSALTSITGTTTLLAENVYHLAFSYDGANMRLYVNGVEDATAVAATGNVTAIGQPVSFGALGNGTESYPGLIDEVALYGTALSSTRLSAHYTAGATSGNATVTAAPFTASAAVPAPVASVSTSVTAPAMASTAAFGTPVVAGTGDATIAVPAFAASAAVAAPTLSADANPTSVAATATAAFLAPSVAATTSATVTALPFAATANLYAPSIDNGSGSQTIVAAAMGATATFVPPVWTNVMQFATDTSNRLDGLDLVCVGRATVTTPVGAAPTGLAERHDVAIPYPAPVMVDGRPT